jgi:tetratricopeptide (TPR) repeat protein
MGTFTIEELAGRSGVSEATVHTVLRRNPTFTRKVGIEPTGRPGGQRHRYLIDPEHEAELRETLENIRAGIVLTDEGPDEPSRLPAALASDPIWLPLSVSAAEAILLDELPTASADRRLGLLHAAEEYIEHARLTRDSADESEPTTAHLAAHLELLDFIRSVALNEVHDIQQGRLHPAALAAQWRKLPWAVLGTDASAKILGRLFELVEASAAQQANAIPVQVVYSAQHSLPSRLDRALELIKTDYHQIHLEMIKLGSMSAVAAANGVSPTPGPRVCVLVFDGASIVDSAPIIAVVSQKLGPMDELVVASEEMNREVYGQALTYGATFLYLDASDTANHALRQGIDRASERFMVELWRSALGAALGIVFHPRRAIRYGNAYGLSRENVGSVAQRSSTRDQRRTVLTSVAPPSIEKSVLPLVSADVEGRKEAQTTTASPTVHGEVTSLHPGAADEWTIPNTADELIKLWERQATGGSIGNRLAERGTDEHPPDTGRAPSAERPASYESGKTTEMEGNWTTAIQAYEAALTKGQRDTDDVERLRIRHFVRRGQAHRAARRYGEALADFTHAIDLDPEDSWALSERGETYRLMSRHEEALADLTRAIDLDPEYSWALASRGETYRLMSRHEEALADFTRAIDLNPEYSWALGHRGETYRLMNRHEEALADLTRVIDLNPEDSWALGHRGETYRGMSRYEEALADFTRAIDLDPEYTWALASRGETYRLMSRHEEALADFTRAIDLNPDYAWALGSRGQAYRALGSNDVALADLTRAIDLDPSMGWALGERGQTYRLMSRHEEALADFTRAIDLNPEDSWALASRGETYRLMGKYEQALADFNRALDLNPHLSLEDAWIVAGRGQTYQALGAHDNAFADFTHATELNARFAYLAGARSLPSHESSLQPNESSESEDDPLGNVTNIRHGDQGGAV